VIAGSFLFPRSIISCFLLFLCPRTQNSEARPTFFFYADYVSLVRFPPFWTLLARLLTKCGPRRTSWCRANLVPIFFLESPAGDSPLVPFCIFPVLVHYVSSGPLPPRDARFGASLFLSSVSSPHPCKVSMLTFDWCTKPMALFLSQGLDWICFP